MKAIAAAAGLLVGALTGFLLNQQVQKPCKFCGYSDDKTQELFKTEELNKLLRDHELYQQDADRSGRGMQRALRTVGPD